MTKELLAKAILAFDYIILDVLADLQEGREPHRTATQILEMLAVQIRHVPGPQGKMQEYVINLADLTARIKMLTTTLPVSEKQVNEAILKQREHLAAISEEVVIVRMPVHEGTGSIN